MKITNFSKKIKNYRLNNKKMEYFNIYTFIYKKKKIYT